MDEGSSFILSLTDPNDPSAADTTAGFEYAFGCGDGYGAFTASNSAACPTDDNGVRAVKGQIRDKEPARPWPNTVQTTRNRVSERNPVSLWL